MALFSSIHSRISAARTQIFMVSLICFACPGIFNSLNALGGAGQSDPTVANNTNTALYACFAVFGYSGGMFFNLLGNRILMGCGGLTYVFYVISQYVAAKDASLGWLAILSGAVLGIGAGLFWTAQGAMTMAYPTEDRKGTYIAIVWVIFNLGGVIGGLASLAINFNNTNSSASPATYFTFAAIMLAGSLSAFVLLVSPKKVRKEDGTSVEFAPAKGVVEEMKSVFLLFANPIMLLLTPLFISSNFFYTYQFNAVNAGLFNVRTRSLNSALYWASQMLAAWLFGQIFLDLHSLSRPARAKIGFLILAVTFTIAWGLGLYLQIGFEGGFDKNDPLPGGPIDMTQTSRYFYPWFCFMLYGFCDALLQTFAYWVMGAVTNDANVSARYAGYYKGIQSAGAAVAWALDNTSMTWLAQLITNWTLFTISLPFLAVVVFRYVTPHTEDGHSHVEDDAVASSVKFDSTKSTSNGNVQSNTASA